VIKDNVKRQIESMRCLFDLGYQMGAAGDAWRDRPPRYLPDQ
jgi:hypothetical protein